MFGFKFDNFGTYGRWRTLDLFEINAKVIIMYNGANRGIKAVLHVVNKFGAGQNNVANLCI